MSENFNNNETGFDVDQTAVDTVSGVDKAPKKKKGLKIAAVCVGAVVVVGGGGAIAYNVSDFVKNKVKLATLKPEEYSAWVYEKNAAEEADEISKAYQEYLDKSKSGVSSSISLKYETTDEAKEMLIQNFLGSSYGDIDNEDGQKLVDIINNIDTIELGVDASVKKSNVLETIYGSLNGEKLVSFDFAVDADAMNYFMRIPELTEKWLGFDLSSVLELDGMASSEQAVFDMVQNIMSNPEEYISPDELSSLITDYVAVWNDTIDDVELEKKEKIEVGSAEVEYTVLTAEIDEKKAIEIAEAFVEKVADDDTIKELATEKLGVCSEDVYDETLSEILDKLKTERKSGDFGDEVLELVTYVDSKGTIRGIEVSMEDEFEFSFIVGADKNNVGGEFRLTTDGEEVVSAVLDAEKNKDTYDGEIDCSVSDGRDSYNFSVEFSNFEIVDEEKGYFNCDAAIIIEGIDPISISFESDGKSQDIIYSIDISGTDFGVITLSVSSDDSADVSVPNADDAYMLDIESNDFDINEYVTEDKVSSFISELFQKLGFTSEDADMISGLLVDELYNSSDYDYGYDDYGYDDYDDYGYDDYDFDNYDDYDYDDYDFDDYYDYDYDSYDDDFGDLF